MNETVTNSSDVLVWYTYTHIPVYICGTQCDWFETHPRVHVVMSLWCILVLVSILMY